MMPALLASLLFKLRLKRPELSPRPALEQLVAIQMLDVHFPATGGSMPEPNSPRDVSSSVAHFLT